MDESETNKDTLTESYFLSSTSYNGLLDTECSINLEQILSDYSSILNYTIEDSQSEEFISTRKDHPSIIIAGNNIDFESEMAEISRIRDTCFSNSIGNSVNRFSLSGISSGMERLSNSILSGDLTLQENSNLMSYTGMKLNWIVNHLPNKDMKIENDLSLPWNSVIDMSFNDQKSNGNVTSDESFKIPDLLVSEVEECSNQRKVIYDQSLNSKLDSSLLTSLNGQNTESNFFSRRKKKAYFISPQKLIIDQTRVKETSEENEDKEFQRMISELSSFCLEDVSSPEWPSFSEDDPREDGNEIPKSLKISTPNDSETSYFGATVLSFFSRKKGSKYFNSPKK